MSMRIESLFDLSVICMCVCVHVDASRPKKGQPRKEKPLTLKSLQDDVVDPD
jgi:hypothetical protein